MGVLFREEADCYATKGGAIEGQAMTVNLTGAQFQLLLQTIANAASRPEERRASFASAKFSYDGTRDRSRVEAFITSASIFKAVERITEADALFSLPLILKNEAATWWNGIKDAVKTWEEYEKRLRRAFAPKRPAHVLFQEIIGVRQPRDMAVETFVAMKRDLLAQLPPPAIAESHQIDMVYGQLHPRLKEKVTRESVTSFDSLLSAATNAEQLFHEELQYGKKNKPLKRRCLYCRLFGHTINVCKKRQRTQNLR